MNAISRTRMCLGFLESKGLDQIDCRLEAGSWGMKISVDAEDLDADQARLLKRIFGPLEVDNGYGYKNLKGSVMLNDSVSIQLTISRVYTCKKLEPEELTEEKWDEVKEKIRSGLVQIEDCTAGDSISF